VNKNKFDFGFGDSYAIREALQCYISLDKIMGHSIPYPGYADKTGDPVLEKYVRDMVERSTGRRYEYVVITNGAHMGVAASLMAMEHRLNASQVYYDELHFLRYPQLVRSLNLLKASREDFYQGEAQTIHLTASPTNPKGYVHSVGDENRTVWDACYHNEIYTSPVSSLHLPRPEHHIMVGSLGKITGLNGMRLGWAATDDQRTMLRLRLHHYDLTLGVSTVNMAIAKTFFREVDQDNFQMRAFNYLSDNRTQLSKLEYLFADKVPSYGMFWFTEVDKQARALLQKVGVSIIEGVECGGTGDQVRITIGQTRDLTREMVKAVLKEDGK